MTRRGRPKRYSAYDKKGRLIEKKKFLNTIYENQNYIKNREIAMSFATMVIRSYDRFLNRKYS